VREYPVSLMREFSFDEVDTSEDRGVPEGYYGTED
jgi:hypothetical protein